MTVYGVRMGETSEFDAAYDAVLAQWPVAYEVLELESTFGRTRVVAAGPVQAPPLVLFHGGGATGTVWFNNIEALSKEHRVFAVDVIYDKGRSVPGQAPVRTRQDVMAWIDALLDALRVNRADLCGHSFGAWIATAYALHTPDRVRRLVLLDPTTVFGGFRPGYLLHALPMLVRFSPARQRRFLRWETGRDLDPVWLTLMATPRSTPAPPFVFPKRPPQQALRGLAAPTLVLLAERSRAINVRRTAATAKRLLPDVRVEVLPGATHHSVPTEQPDAVNAAVKQFLAD